MQSTSILAHRGTKSFARSSPIAIRAGRNRLVGETLPDFAVEVGSIHHLAGISIGAGGDLLRYPVVEQSGGVGGHDEGAARGQGCGVGQDYVGGSPLMDARDS